MSLPERLALLGAVTFGVAFMAGMTGALQEWEEYPGKAFIEKGLEYTMSAGFVLALGLLVASGIALLMGA